MKRAVFVDHAVAQDDGLKLVCKWRKTDKL